MGNTIESSTFMSHLAFMVYPINMKSGVINLNKLQCAVQLDISSCIEAAIDHYAVGKVADQNTKNNSMTQTIKLDAILALLVYNHRIDINLDFSDSYLLIKKFDRIILTTESLMKQNLGYVAQPISNSLQQAADSTFTKKTDLFVDHAEFNIIIHNIVETNLNGDVKNHSVATFEPLNYHAPCETTSFNFIREHVCRNERKTEYDSRLHYDFFHQDWELFRGVTDKGVLPNGHKLQYLSTYLY